MLLADLGAEVIKIERPPHGDTARDWPSFGPSVFLALNRNKKSLALNLSKEPGRKAFQRLVRKADIVVENMAPGIVEKLGASYDAVRKLNSSIVYCSISGYGKSNPYSELPAWDPVIQALSGLMSVTGEKDGAPVRIGVSVVDMGAGLFATLGILSALLSRKQRRKPKSMFLDISLFDSATVWMAFWVVYYSLFQKVPERLGSAWPAFCPYQVFKAQDGFVFIGASNEEYWRKLCGPIGADFLLKDERFSTNSLRLEHSAELIPLLQGATSKMKRDEIVSVLRKDRVPCSPVNNVSELVQDVALEGRKMIERMTFGESTAFLTVANPLRSSKIGAARAKPPPKLGEDSLRILQSLGYSKLEARKIMEEDS
jgi:crotonobetainyl-CoA:carnitine CoA-transferase CaiB-like acyl-CoA transferase